MRKNCEMLLKTLDKFVIGKTEQLKLAITCLIANGHLLIEDLPGMGKTTLSHALAKAWDLDYSRVQFTSDLLPTDVLGVSIFDAQEQTFRFHQGPIFNHLVLADEINRASPKTQSALLEAMEERQVSIDGVTHRLPEPFFVIATQNPSHQSGTYPLPESQLDRFLMRITLGYPDWEAEKAMLKQDTLADVKQLNSQLSIQDLLSLQHTATQVHASDAVIHYILRLVSYSRESGHFPNPLSPRASKALLHAARAWAVLHDRDYLIPEDVQAVFAAVAEHRLRSENSNHFEKGVLSQRLLEQVDPLAA